MLNIARTKIASRLKTLAAAACSLAVVIALSSCAGGAGAANAEGSGTQEDKGTIAVSTLDANGSKTTVDVPLDPQRIAVLDMAALDIIDSLGMGERVVGTALVSSAGSSIDYLDAYADSGLPSLGTIQTPDLEAIAACSPDVIFVGPRLASYYDQLSEIAPCVQMAVDSDKGVLESTVDNVKAVSSLFGIEDSAADRIADIEKRIEALRAKAEGSSALVALFTSGSINVLGDDARCSLIGREIGFDNLASDDVTSTHGNEISFETLVEKDPAYIFVLDRDAAIGASGSSLAREVIENDLTKKTSAYENGRIVYLSSPAVWYTAEGGLSALETMLTDIESALA